MESALMELKVLVPYGVMTAKTNVTRIVVETVGGSYGFWPDRLDCGAALVAGILIYETKAEGVVYIAIDEGVVVKTGRAVFVSARNAISGKELGKLRKAVEHEFVDLEEREKNVRAVLSKLESGFIRNFQELINR